jgi:hypothetical protein
MVLKVLFFFIMSGSCSSNTRSMKHEGALRPRQYVQQALFQPAACASIRRIEGAQPSTQSSHAGTETDPLEAI